MSNRAQFKNKHRLGDMSIGPEIEQEAQALSPCIKVRHETKGAALAFQRGKRAYRCPLCSGWHLTSSPKKH